MKKHEEQAGSPSLLQELLTPNSLAMPISKNNFWYVSDNTETVFIFVHGIFSDSRRCWLSEEPGKELVFWPDLVRRDSARLGRPSIFLAGYYTEIESGDYSVAQCARELLDALDRAEKDGKTPVAMSRHRMVFICHSTGGIVVRYLLDRYKDRFRDKEIGLCLIASPSLGSIWANVAFAAAKFCNNRLVAQLRRGGELLEDIHGRFCDLVNNHEIPGLFGMEACESKMIFRAWIPSYLRWIIPSRWKVVNTLSAGQYFGEVKILSDTNHFTTVKPTCLEHPSHEFLVTFYEKFSQFSKNRLSSSKVIRVPPLSSESDLFIDLRLKQIYSASSSSFLLTPKLRFKVDTITETSQEIHTDDSQL